MSVERKPALPDGATAAQAWPWRDQSLGPRVDVLADEVPVALVFNGISHAVMMATPAQLEDFALGFSLTEGLIDTPSDLYGLEIVNEPDGLSVQLEVSAQCAWRLKERRRTLAGRTGCGLCGTDSLAQVRRTLPPVRAVSVSARAIVRAEAALRDLQVLQQLTGATHAAAWADLSGRIVCIREDIGRHNALDKLAGALVHNGTDVSLGFVLVTSRASFEMVQKTAAIGAGLLAAVSAPTRLAVECAQEANLCLAGFTRAGSMSAYTFADRIVDEQREH